MRKYDDKPPAIELGKLPRPLYAVERRRLNDGRRALRLKEPRSLREMKVHLSITIDGARALQSLDDLGLKANESTYMAMLWLMRRAQELEREIKKREEEK